MKRCPFPNCPRMTYDWNFCCTTHFLKLPLELKQAIESLMTRLRNDDVSLGDFGAQGGEIIETCLAREVLKKTLGE